jgi:hypothetical protein
MMGIICNDVIAVMKEDISRQKMTLVDLKSSKKQNYVQK